MFISKFSRYVGWLLPAAFSLVLSLGCAERHPFEALSADAVVLAFGDSVTAGVGASAGEDYPGQLAELTGLKVVNAGVSGDTAREAGKRLGPLLANHQPDMVIVELGGNDFLRQTQAARVKEYVRGIIRAAHETGAVVVLVSVPRLSLLRASVGALTDSPIYAELAAEEGVLLVPDVFSEVLSDDALHADKIHPNARGYRQLAQGIQAVLVDRGLLTD
jgi:acyl-CoA thioesterase-1